jgi:DNA-binding response OmpR family regulator
VSIRPRVLIADDDPDILELVSLTLERDGHEVVTANNGVEALRLATERRLHLAVLDVMMPGLDGFEVTRRLRADNATKGIPIMLLTAFAEENHTARGLEAGADAYMKKPFSPRELVARTSSLLLEHRPRSRLAQDRS